MNQSKLLSVVYCKVGCKAQFCNKCNFKMVLFSMKNSAARWPENWQVVIPVSNHFAYFSLYSFLILRIVKEYCQISTVFFVWFQAKEWNSCPQKRRMHCRDIVSRTRTLDRSILECHSVFEVGHWRCLYHSSDSTAELMKAHIAAHGIESAPSWKSLATAL